MAAYAALVSLMNNIEQMMNHPRVSNYLDNKLIQPLLEKAGLLLDIVEANNYGGGSKEAEFLERQIISAAHAVEDVIENHIVDQIHAGSADDGDTSSSFSIDLQQIIEDMDAVVEKAMHMEVKEKEGLREGQPTHSAPLMENGEIAMVGLDDELTQLIDELTGHQCNRQSISIVGMGGMGKTTLAKNIYANPYINDHFDIHAWATVSQEYNVDEILSQLLSSLGKLTSDNVGDLGEQLHKTLKYRRYLVILDDIWSVEAWDEVMRYLPDDGNRSRVVLTTRLSYVASICGSSRFTMNLLDEDKSWKLFCQKAHFPQKDDPLQLEDVGKEIVRLCKGLALSIVVIGGFLLKSPRTVGFWDDVAQTMISIPNSMEKRETLDALSLSYNHLPPHLKPCFLYMGGFREDSVIRVSNVTKIWIAEGFIRPNGNRALEEIAEGYLKDLIDRNLIFVRRRRSNGKIGSCGIHDMLRDLCVKVAEQQDLFRVRKYGEIRSRDRRLACNPFQKDIVSSVTRSILTWNVCAHSIKCKLLRVLADSDNKVHPSFQEVLYESVNLRYLAYKQLYDTQPTWKLPDSVFLIWNLQTLMITPEVTCPLIVVAPSKIWKMRQLRHIKFPQIYLPPPPPSDGEDNNLFILLNLQTLAKIVNLRLSEELCKIIPNLKKLHLLYTFRLEGYDDSLIERLFHLDRLLKLETLYMDMRLSYEWKGKLHKKLAFPSSLKKLSLIYCGLHWKDLSMIGLLPQLQVLHLEQLSISQGRQWSPANGQFRHLKFLKIERCDLFHWDADSSHFPVLEKLVLSKVYHLEEIPVDMGEIPTLAFIRVDRCNESVSISAMRLKEHQLESQDNDALQIQVIMRRWKVSRFEERVKTEQLPFNYIQLVSLGENQYPAKFETY